jgi:hypothetical protein
MPEGPSSALETLCAAFRLTAFERDVLLLSAGPDLDGGFPALCAAAHGDAGRAHPTFGLALAVLPDAHWSAITPAGPLRRWRLLEMGSGEGLCSTPLRIDERVLHYLAGINYVDERLHFLASPIPPPDALPPSQRKMARRLSSLWSGAPRREPPVAALCGVDRAGVRAIAAAAAADLGARCFLIHAGDLPAAAQEQETLATLWNRECILSGGVLLLDMDELEGPDETLPALAFLDRLSGPVAVSAREMPRPRGRLLLRLDTERLTTEEVRHAWRTALGGSSDADTDVLAAQFRLSGQQVRAAVETACNGSPDGLSTMRLWDACREQARPALGGFAQRIEPSAGWEDLVVPDEQLESLLGIAAHVRRQTTVYETWGFAAKGARGLGISALFAGPSGTGKTMAAEVLARDLRLDLFRIDLSAVVSKYIGETEKNLRRVFDAAEAGGAILLFDEADALFGKRTEVKDSHDRYANVEVSYLLQRMEAYRGLAILTTNMKTAIDPAFLRRIRFVVSFPFPDARQRAAIWERIFPEQTPTEGLDVDRLARLNVSGGNIRNIALNAAFLAADAGEPVHMSHLLRAARTECLKLEKPLSEAEIGGWA